MENINKGDKVLNPKTKVEYIVDTVETYDGVTVVFTEGRKTNCFPMTELIKIPKSVIANYFLKKINKINTTDDEESQLINELSKLKLVTIKPFDPSFFDGHM